MVGERPLLSLVERREQLFSKRRHVRSVPRHVVSHARPFVGGRLTPQSPLWEVTVT